MFIKQSNLFWGMDKKFVQNFMNLTEKINYTKGQYVFQENDPAEHFFIMLKGRVEIKQGTTGVVIHNVNHAGEAFGWSSLLDRESYTASAQCLEDTVLITIRDKDVTRVVEKDPENGMIFYKRLAGMLGQRLLSAYKIKSDVFETLSTLSYGSGQMLMPDLEL